MSTSSITSKGQITIPSDLRAKFQLQPGDKILFEEKEGVITLTPLSDDIEALGGCLANLTNGRKASMEDMEQSIIKGASSSWQDNEDTSDGRH
ncbi:MAG: AbrB/MazE/SpoVT family DNA-binding domain-containing protein [Endozoicomonas sp.]|uniref:AbrB/MazE/SpoVT family DNA-binding domain-containing protein n=1 Tax=Endozoicomonas sp. TaxID=1892382 RepID=UPI003D9B4964